MLVSDIQQSFTYIFLQIFFIIGYYKILNIVAWASLVVQLVKNLPAMQETPVRVLGQEDPLEKGQATHSSILRPPLWLSW